MVRERLIAEPGVIKLHDVEASLPGRASCRARGKNPSQSACSQSSPCIFTRPTRFELVWWIRRLPSLVTQKFRMMPTKTEISQSSRSCSQRGREMPNWRRRGTTCPSKHVKAMN